MMKTQFFYAERDYDWDIKIELYLLGDEELKEQIVLNDFYVFNFFVMFISETKKYPELNSVCKTLIEIE